MFVTIVELYEKNDRFRAATLCATWLIGMLLDMKLK